MVMYNQEKRSHSAKWTSRDHWLFLNAVANGPQRMIDTIGEWQELVNGIPGKTPDEVKAYYKAVEHDLLEIEAGRVKLPNYPDDDDDIGGESSVVEEVPARAGDLWKGGLAEHIENDGGYKDGYTSG
ncbi:putative transcription factor MYB-HB-like family [Helianthus annuus]|uniref:Putative homeodomain-like protein n=1 Tax=Helianthus annuus TaxID=4232 RepID=A0A251S5D0_HELAN|nr:putative transcription factor MYB-HB-like family [Helianthus annuus]KAJ0843214.1 putative transcription factor MYB-HB-like family [Helianthus annuus]